MMVFNYGVMLHDLGVGAMGGEMMIPTPAAA